MISQESRLQKLPCRFVSLHFSSILGFLCGWVSPLAGVSRSSSKRFLVSILHGIAASKRVSSFFLAFLKGFLILFVFGIDEVHTPQFSRTVELRLLNGPSLLFGCFRQANPHLRQQKIRSGSCLDLCQALPGPQKSWRVFLIQ